MASQMIEKTSSESLDLDELFGFREAQRRLLEPKWVAPEEAEYIPHQIFVNDVDSFIGKQLVKLFSQQTYTNVGDELGEEEAGEEPLESEPNEDEEVEEEEETMLEDLGDIDDFGPLDDEEDVMPPEPGEEIAEHFNPLGGFDVGKLTVKDYTELLDIESERERVVFIKKKLSEPHSKQVQTEEEKPEKIESMVIKKPPPIKYEVIGTVKDCNATPPNVKEVFCEPIDRPKLLKKVLQSGVVVYNVTSDPEQVKEALWALNAILDKLWSIGCHSPKTLEALKDIRVFILISPIMTWALTKPIDPYDPDVPFTEEDYKKRKPHPSYKSHIELEREVMKAGKEYIEHLKTITIVSGIAYGHDEDILGSLFKMAWLNEPEMPVFGKGKNLVPLIHVEDLAKLVFLILSNFPTSDSRYVFAVELERAMLKDIVKAISTSLTTGKIKVIEKEAGLLIKEIPMITYDNLTVNLNIEPVLIQEQMVIEWKSEVSFVENITKIVMEFKNAHKLTPVRLFIHGPPACGKTTIAHELAEYYRIPHLTTKDVIDGHISTLKNRILTIKAQNDEKEAKLVAQTEAKALGKPPAAGSDDEDEEDEDEEEVDLAGIEEELEQLENELISNDGRLESETVLRLFKEKLLSKTCLNPGFILDGYPQTQDDAIQLFATAGEEEEEEENVEDEELEAPKDAKLYNKKIMPDHIFCLEASDEFLFEKVLSVSDCLLQGTRYTETEMIRRLTQYRANNTDEASLVNYFDEMEIHPHMISMERDPSPTYDSVVQAIKAIIGPPRTLASFSKAYMQKIEEEERRKKEEEEKRIRDEEEKRLSMIEAEKQKMEDWASLLDSLKQEEEEILAVKGEPLRHYLMKYVFPTLVRALTEVAKVRPEDPLDFLAEYLFRENPEGKMFEPDYSQVAEDLLEAIRKFQTSLLKTDCGGHYS